MPSVHKILILSNLLGIIGMVVFSDLTLYQRNYVTPTTGIIVLKSVVLHWCIEIIYVKSVADSYARLTTI